MIIMTTKSMSAKYILPTTSAPTASTPVVLAIRAVVVLTGPEGGASRAERIGTGSAVGRTASGVGGLAAGTAFAVLAMGRGLETGFGFGAGWRGGSGSLNHAGCAPLAARSPPASPNSGEGE